MLDGILKETGSDQMQHDESKAESFSLGRWLSEGIQRTQREGMEFAHRLGFTGISISTLARQLEHEFSYWDRHGYALLPPDPASLPDTPETRRVRCLLALETVLNPFSYLDDIEAWAKVIDKNLALLRRLCEKAAPQPETRVHGE